MNNVAKNIATTGITYKSNSMFAQGINPVFFQRLYARIPVNKIAKGASSFVKVFFLNDK